MNMDDSCVCSDGKHTDSNNTRISDVNGTCFIIFVIIFLFFYFHLCPAYI